MKKNLSPKKNNQTSTSEPKVLSTNEEKLTRGQQILKEVLEFKAGKRELITH